jgi:hypothetical protein
MLRRQIQAVIGLTASNTELLNWVAPTLVKGWVFAIDPRRGRLLIRGSC